ncbi:MAG: xylulokinase [Clostridia bacterium]
MFYVGIDLGTSSVKLILCDKDGNVLNSVTKDYPISFPCEGYSEQNPYDWYDKTIEGLCELTKNVSDKVAGLSVAGQMHGLVMLDENDSIIRPAILWNDSRSSSQCDYLNSIIGKDVLNKETCNIAFPGFTAPKILWVQEHEKENFDKCRKIMLPKDYIVYRLTGQFVTEGSDASGLLLFDVENNRYSKKMLDICKIDECMLPKIKKSYENIGFIKDEIATKLGFGKVTVAPGGGDNACAAIGMGVLGNNMCSVSLGTSGTMFITTEKFSYPKNNALHFFRHADGNFHLMGCILSAASCNKWWIEDILKSDDYSEFENVLPDGENKVFFLPYLMGERSPHNDPYARGAFIGMSMDTTREDMAKAVMEGVCYALRDSVEEARSEGYVINSVRLCGGGSRNRAWIQMLANILKVDVILPNDIQGPAMGAAILSMVAAGEYDSVKAATEKIVKMKEYINYDTCAAEKYDKGYEKFKNLYKCLKNWYRM